MNFEAEWKEIQSMKKGSERTVQSLNLVIRILKRINQCLIDSEKRILIKFLDGEITRDQITCCDEELTEMLKSHKLI